MESKVFLESMKQAYVSSLSQFTVFNVTVQEEDMILAATLFTSSYISFFLHSVIENRKLDKRDTYACLHMPLERLCLHTKRICAW